MTTCYVSIGNSDDKLTQAHWALFCHDLRTIAEWVAEEGGAVHGVWYSAPDSPWQNMCICLDVPTAEQQRLRLDLITLAGTYNQDSISLAWVAPEGQEFTSADDTP